MAGGILQVGGRPLVEHAAGEIGRDQDLLGRAQAAHVDEHDPALPQVAQHGPAHGDVGVGCDALQLHDPPGPAVHDLEGVERQAPSQLDVAKPGQVLDRGEGRQPRQPVRAVVAFELEERLLLGPAPLVGGAQVVDGELAQAQAQGRGVGQAAGRVGAKPLPGPGVASQRLAVLAVGVDQQEAVAPLAGHHRPGQHAHEVRLAHARGGEDADVAGQAGPGNADLEVDLGLPAAQAAHGQVPHAGGQEGEVGGLRRHHAGELRGQALGLAEAPPVRGEVPQAAALGHPVSAPPGLVERVGAGLTAGVVGQHGARHPLGPARLPVLGAVGDVDDAEQVAPPGGLVHADEQLAQEQVLIGGGPEGALQHVAAEQPPPARVRAHARSMRRWRSAKARSRTSGGTPARSRASSTSSQASSLSQRGQAASRSATVRG